MSAGYPGAMIRNTLLTMVVALAAVAGLPDRGARAAQPTPAERLHDAAVAAHEAGRLRQAIELWRDALKLEPNWKYAYNLANTSYEVEDGKDAWEALRRVDQLGPPDKYVGLVAELRSKVRALLYRDHAWLVLVGVPAGAEVRRDGERWEPPYDAWVKAATSVIEVKAEGFEALREEVAHPIGDRTERRIELAKVVVAPEVVRGSLRIEGTPVGATVTVGGAVLGVLPLGPVEVDEGLVEVRVSHPGFVDAVRSVRVVGGQEAREVVTLEAAPPVVTKSELTTAGWIMVASGAVLVGVGAGFHAWADDTYDEVRALNQDAERVRELGLEGYRERYEELDGAASDRALVSQLLWVAGGAAVATGVVLLLLDESVAQDEGAVHVVPVSGGAVVVGGATF